MSVWLERWFHESLTQTVDGRRQARMMFALTVALVLGGVIVCIEHYKLGNVLLARDFGILVVLGACTIFAFHFVGSPHIIGNIVPLQVLAGATIINLHNGGIGYPSFFALILAPQSAFLLAGARSGLLFGALSLAEMYGLWRLHPDPTAISSAHAWPVSQVAGGTSLLVTISGLTWAYVSQKNDTVDELERQRRRADEATRSQGEFLANVSHEIRTPMNGVLGSLELLASEVTGDQRETVRVATQSARSLLRLLDDVLAMSRLQGTEVPLRTAPADLREVVLQVTQWFSAQAQNRGLTLTTDVPESSLNVLVDAPRLQQVLANLVGNALKFTEAGEVQVKLRADAGRVSIAVEDTGCGIPAEHLERIFERFQQVDGSLARQHGGTGLGLSISRELVQRMGGALTVESEVGKGTRFLIAIELEPSEAPGPTPFETPAVVAEVRKPVLLVEDDNVNRMVCTRLLERLGVPCESVTNGEDAVSAARTGGFSLVLMDCQMPLMDGFEATRRIRALEEPASLVPVVALTAQALDGDREACIAAGMNDYATKPVTKESLARIVSQWATGRPG